MHHRVQSRSEDMGIRKLTDLERELNGSYTENLSINTDSSNPCIRDVLRMLGDRALSLSLRRHISLN
jgi:hypothetical protein